jgi:hypothetical protein
MPAGSWAALMPAVIRISGSGSGIVRFVRGEPDQAAAPIVEPARGALAPDRRGDRRSARRCGGNAPDRGVPRLGERGRVAHGPPQRAALLSLHDMRLAIPAQETAQLADAIADRLRKALDAHQGARFRAADPRGQMSGAGQLERRAEGRGERFDGRRIGEARQDQGRDLLLHRQHLEGHLGQQTESAPGSGHQLHEIETGDVLHHPSAGLDRLAAPVDEAHADQTVAGGTRIDAAGPGIVGRRHRAEGRLAGRAEERAVIHRLEGQHLPTPGQQRLHLGERRTGAGRDHHLGRLVEGDAGEPGRGERRLVMRRTAERRLGAAADEPQRFRAAGSLRDDGGRLLLVGRRV